jgi:hypothetical protein
MAHYAKCLNIDNSTKFYVEQVIVADADFIETQPGKWVQTSYNTKGNVHYGPDGQPDGGVAVRGNYAGIGYTYDIVNDVFYSPKPFPSWILNESTWTWEAPVPYPTDGGVYQWNEETQAWDAVTDIPTV